jgi:SpoVK/Ycf46/Vps4 family AAA+-type ATPase
MMTNVSEIIDEASLRAGRVDRRIKFEIPNKLERKIAFEDAINEVNKKAKYQVIRNYNTEILSNMSENFNYADIYQSIDNSVKNKVKQLIKYKEPGIVRAGYIKQKSLEQEVLNHQKEFKDKNNKNNKNIGFIL